MEKEALSVRAESGKSHSWCEDDCREFPREASPELRCLLSREDVRLCGATATAAAWSTFPTPTPGLQSKRQRVRAYFPEAMAVTKRHEDAQHGNGHSNCLRYVATYAPKFSESFASDWLNDEASDCSVARRVLFSYHPLEPECK